MSFVIIKPLMCISEIIHWVFGSVPACFFVHVSSSKPITHYQMFSLRKQNRLKWDVLWVEKQQGNITDLRATWLWQCERLSSDSSPPLWLNTRNKEQDLASSISSRWQAFSCHSICTQAHSDFDPIHFFFFEQNQFCQEAYLNMVLLYNCKCKRHLVN